jgi:hypothetical protein
MVSVVTLDSNSHSTLENIQSIICIVHLYNSSALLFIASLVPVNQYLVIKFANLSGVAFVVKSFILLTIFLILAVVINQFVCIHVDIFFAALVFNPHSVNAPNNHHSNHSSIDVNSQSKALFITSISAQSFHPFKKVFIVFAHLGNFSANFSKVQNPFKREASFGYLVRNSARLASHTHGIIVISAVAHKSVTKFTPPRTKLSSSHGVIFSNVSSMPFNVLFRLALAIVSSSHISLSLPYPK